MRLFIISGIILATLSTTAHSADINIVKGGIAKTSIDLSGLTASGGRSGQALKTALENDLVRSGWFKVVRPGSATITIRGQSQHSGNSISARCLVSSAASGKAYLNRSYNDTATNVRKLAHRIADDIVQAVKGVKGIASTQIVMVGKRSGTKDLYLCDYDGGNLRGLTPFKKICIGPYWSKDGKYVTYTSYKSGFPEVYQIDMRSRGHKKLTNFPGLSTGGCMSPDGSSIALILSKDGNSELYVQNLRTRRLTRLTATRRAVESSPVWSPDGRSIAFVSNKALSPQIYTVSRSGGSEKRMSYVGTENVAPDWGPDGRLTWCSRRNRQYHIVVRQKNGKEVQITKQNADFEDPSWARDGRHIYCARTTAYQSKIYMLDTLGDPAVCLTTIAGDWYSPACSP